MRASNRRCCSSWPTSSQNLIRMMPDLTMWLSNSGQSLDELLVLLLRAEAHHVLDAGAVVPAAVEDDDLAGGREVLHVALHVELRLLPVGRGRQGDQPEDARADALRDRLDGPAFAGGVASLEHDDDAQTLRGRPSPAAGTARSAACAAPSRISCASSLAGLMLRLLDMAPSSVIRAVSPHYRSSARPSPWCSPGAPGRFSGWSIMGRPGSARCTPHTQPQ